MKQNINLTFVRCWRAKLAIRSYPLLPDGPFAILLNIARHCTIQIGGRRAIFLYATAALGYVYTFSVCGRNLDVVSSLQLITWFVPSVVGDAIAVSLIGLLLGPMSPLVMANSRKIIPEWLVTASISFMVGIGQSGSAILPFAIGAIVGKWGIESLQPL